MRFSARIMRALLASIITLILLLPNIATPVLAQSVQSDTFYQNVESDVPHNFGTFTQAAFFGIATTTICVLTGTDITNPEKGCLEFNPLTQKLGYSDIQQNPTQPGGLLGATTVLIGAMYTQPASSTQYVRHLADNFGFIDKATAQTDDGFDGLGPLLQLFVRIRDITYLLLVIVFIIVGIGIMLRLNIDPRTVMTIQNQIPKLIIGIILVTFSYSIAGFMFDMTWAVTYFGINTITASKACPSEPDESSLTEVATTNLLNVPFWYVSDVFSKAGCHGSFDGVSGIAWNVSASLGNIVAQANLERLGLGNDSGDGCDPSVGWSGINVDFQDCAAAGIGWVIKWLITVILFIVLLISIFIQLFKVWYMLLRAYISILIAIILAPLWIIMGVIPGGGLGFGQWMRHMVAHLAIFPAAALMFTLASYISGNPSFNNIEEGAIYTLPLLGNPNINEGISFGYIMALGFILLTPDLLNLIRDALKTPQGKYTGGIFKRGESGNPMKLGTSVASIGGIGYNLQGISALRERNPFGKKSPKTP